MKRFFFAIFWLVIGYFAGGLAGYWLAMTLSSNTHDKVVEAATLGGLFVGPLASIIACVVYLAISRKQG
jgi:hypothetical protein